MKRPVLLSFATLIVVSCLLLSALGIGGAVVLLQNANAPATPAALAPTSAPTRAPTTVKLPTQTPGGPTATAGVPPTPLPVAPVPADIASQMDKIEQQVIAIRGLQPNAQVNRGLLTKDQLTEKVKSDFFKDYTPEKAKDDVREYVLLGLLNPDFDLLDLYTKLYAEQIAGFYDPETKQMYVVQGESFAGTERMTYSHEFTHVLQDQNYDLLKGLKTEQAYCDNHSEHCAAVQALIEGDATVAEQTWLLKYSTTQDKKDILAFSQGLAMPVYDSAPDFLKQDMMFPYDQGMAFVNDLLDRGGYTAVDNAFKNPPESTAQILHPELYPDFKPQDVKLPDLLPVLGSGWRTIDDNVLGEWYHILLLSAGADQNAQVGGLVAKQAAAGWDGDVLGVYWNDTNNRGALVLHTHWTSDKEATQFTDAFTEYAKGRWGNPTSSANGMQDWTDTKDGAVQYFQNGAETIWVIGPDAAAAQKLVDAVK